MDQKNIQRYIGKLSNKVRRRLDMLSGQYGSLTGTEECVLDYLLAQEKDVFQRDVESEFDLRAPTASEMLKSMEAKGVIVRTPTAQDARLKKITITPLGASFREQVQEDLSKMYAQILEGISEDEQKQFCRIAETMLKNLSNV